MERRTARRVGRLVAVAGVIVLFGGGAAAPSEARVTQGSRVEIQSVAGLAPDGRSIGVQVLASCPVRVRASDGVYRAGEAVALTFADIEFQGEIFYGVDDGPIQLVS
jgi:hypothetical protein